MLRIIHYREKCIGCYYCVEVAPQRWQMNEEDGKSDLLESTKKKNYYEVIVFDDELQSVKEAESVCPTKVIKVEIID